MLWPVYSRIEDAWAYFAGRPSLRKLNLALFRLGARGLGLHNYTSRHISGEIAFLRGYLSSKTNPIVFDVGANEGHWSADVLSINPAATIYAFEPHPVTYLRLKSRLNGFAFNLGISDKAGRLTLHDYQGDGSTHASFVDGVIEDIHKGHSVAHQVAVTTINSFASDHGITHIDLLKIDVEGLELSVINGANGVSIDAIQFEFNEMNVLPRHLFRDFHDLLSPLYSLYRLLPHGMLPLNDYQAWSHEQFVFQNVVAIRKGV